jgi:hypothetical protein
MVSTVADPDSPASTSAASPGARRSKKKLRTMMTTIVGAACTSVRRNAFNTLADPIIPASGQPAGRRS